MKDDISPCPGCHCMTHSIRQSRANYKCGKCGYDKSLSDVFFYEKRHPPEIKCPYCKYGGEDLKIGRVPISNKMMCSKCKRYFNPFAYEQQAVGGKE